MNNVKKRVAILADANNYHTQKWATSLSSKGIEILVISLNNKGLDFYSNYPGITCISLGLSNDLVTTGSIIQKLTYLKYIFQIRRILKKYEPDLLHSHYISSYGFLGALTFYKPYITSVWGSDIYLFPRKSFLHRSIIKFTLNRADKILSTSHCMALEIGKYSRKKCHITPYGVDVAKFRPMKTERNRSFVFGTIKKMSDVYGIDILLKSFSKLLEVVDEPVQLIIAGDGPKLDEYKKMSEELGINNKVSFLGFVNNNMVPELLNTFDVFVALSRSESFGVSAIESMACEVPVLVSSADGFKEIVNKEAGVIVEKGNIEEAVFAMKMMIKTKDKLHEMGTVGRQHVLKKYTLEYSLNTMIEAYNMYL